MSIAGHLIEAQRRVLIAAAGIVMGAVIGWLLTPILWAAIEQPVRAIAEVRTDARLIFPTLTAAFDLRLQLAVVAGIVISSPVWLYEAFAFVQPAMKRREKRFTLGFVGAAVPLFLAGAFAGWLTLPHMVQILTSFVPEESGAYLDASLYFQFVLKLVLVIGIAFVLPVFLVGLNLAGVLSAQAILRSWRVAVLVITLFTALATPAADIVSMILLAVPMTLLFFGAWFVCWIHDRQAAKRAEVPIPV